MQPGPLPAPPPHDPTRALNPGLGLGSEGKGAPLGQAARDPGSGLAGSTRTVGMKASQPRLSRDVSVSTWFWKDSALESHSVLQKALRKHGGHRHCQKPLPVSTRLLSF